MVVQTGFPTLETMTNTNMRAVRQERVGGPEVLVEAQVPAPSPGRGEVGIAVKAAGVSFGETMIRRGHFPPPGELPWIPGFEIAGEVIEIGSGVSDFGRGDRVVAMLGSGGGYAARAVAPTWAVARLPVAVDHDEGVAIVSNGLSALGLLDHVPLQKGQSVLVTAAAGGVGSLAVQLARVRGASKVIGVVGSTSKLDLVRSLGADTAISCDDPDWTQVVRAATGHVGVDVILDAVGGAIFDGCLDVLAPGGTIVPYGKSCGAFGVLDEERLQQLAFAQQRVAGFVLVADLQRDPCRIREGLAELFTHVESGALRPIVFDRFDLADAPRSHALLEGRQTTGKLVLHP